MHACTAAACGFTVGRVPIRFQISFEFDFLSEATYTMQAHSLCLLLVLLGASDSVNGM